MAGHTLTGFGFGPIQAGLFVSEAYSSGSFDRMVVAEVDQQLVDAVRADNGGYAVNVANDDGIEIHHIEGIEIFNPNDSADRIKLLEALKQSTEVCTSLPSVDFYTIGQHSVASLISEGLQSSEVPATVVYTAENNNHAAEILEGKVQAKKSASWGRPVQLLNTVIGKMSQVVGDPDEIARKGLRPIADNIERAFLVESFNKIMVTRCRLSGFRPGISVFMEKDDLLPFEEAKLYGHNAIHALLAFLGAQRGCKKMAELADYNDVMHIARQAFVDESGAALRKKFAALNDDLFTEAGFKEYANDLLARMTNPWLDDSVERAARDPQRKLRPTDRIFGTMALCLEQGILPKNMAIGAAAGIAYYLRQAGMAPDTPCRTAIKQLWQDQTSPHEKELIELVQRQGAAGVTR